MSTKVVYCPRCGEIELGSENYNRQMAKAGLGWYCPVCGSQSAWVGEFSPCPVCNEPTSHDEENCQHCGIDQQAIYYAIRGDAEAQNYVRKQCDEMCATPDGDA